MGDRGQQKLIRVQEISKTFHLSAKQRKMEHSASKTKTAVDQVSFCVKRGEVFGLLGPNGAGKTTTLRMLATLIRPDSGDAVLSGSSVVTQAGGVRRKIGFLTSELKLETFCPGLCYGFFSELYGIPTDRRDARKRMYLHGSAFRVCTGARQGFVHGNEAEGIPGDLTGAGSGDHHF